MLLVIKYQVPYLHKILVLSEEPYDKYYETAVKYILKGPGQRNRTNKRIPQTEFDLHKVVVIEAEN